jgi:tight adherence protein C
VTILLPLLAFLFASALVAGAAWTLAPGSVGTMERRLGELTGAPLRETVAETSFHRPVVDALKRLGSFTPQRLSEMSKLQQRLVAAGYRNSEAIAVFFGIRIGVAVIGFLLLSTPFIFRPNLTLALVACILGYVLPGMLLGRLAKKRQHRIRLALPDALDLLVVSVEAGLGLDQAILRVGDELAFAPRALGHRAHQAPSAG